MNVRVFAWSLNRFRSLSINGEIVNPCVLSLRPTNNLEIAFANVIDSEGVLLNPISLEIESVNVNPTEVSLGDKVSITASVNVRVSEWFLNNTKSLSIKGEKVMPCPIVLW